MADQPLSAETREHPKFYDNQPLDDQVAILADFLMERFGGPWRSMGAIEMAMRLLDGESPGGRPVLGSPTDLPGFDGPSDA